MKRVTGGCCLVLTATARAVAAPASVVQAGLWVLAVLWLLPLILAAPAFADYEDGVAAYDRGDPAGALREWLPLAEAGLSEAQDAIGMLYRKGQSVPQNHVVANGWFEKAAKQGFPLAQLHLAYSYRQGLGVAQDFGRSADWYRRAALNGLAEAQYNLGVLYGAGKGITQDMRQAYVWSGLAAATYPPGKFQTDAQENQEMASSRLSESARRAADAELAFRLGWSYLRGVGVSMDRAKASTWLCKSSKLGLEAAHSVVLTLAIELDSADAMASAPSSRPSPVDTDPIEFWSTHASVMENYLRHTGGGSMAQMAAAACR